MIAVIGFYLPTSITMAVMYAVTHTPLVDLLLTCRAITNKRSRKPTALNTRKYTI